MDPSSEPGSPEDDEDDEVPGPDHQRPNQPGKASTAWRTISSQKLKEKRSNRGKSSSDNRDRSESWNSTIS